MGKKRGDPVAVFTITVQQTNRGDVVRVHRKSSLFRVYIQVSLLGVLCQLLLLPYLLLSNNMGLLESNLR